jgi:hypothetical protein
LEHYFHPASSAHENQLDQPMVKKPATADPCKRLVKVTETYQIYQSLEIKTGFQCFHMLSQLI